MNYRSIFYYFIVTKNLTFLYSCFAVLSPPTKLELILAGKAKEKQSLRAGTYILGDGLVNGYPHWLQTGDGSQEAIWFSKVGSAWLVNKKSRLGTDYGGISGPNGIDSYPNEIKQGWEYGDGTNWHEVPSSDVIFKAFDSNPKAVK